MFRKYLILFLLQILVFQLYATHNRAGELLYEAIAPLKYRVTVITYSKISDISANADRDSLNLNWGDGTIESIVRVNGPLVNGIPNGELIGNDIKKNIYISEIHDYLGALPFYIISVKDQNRIQNIKNIAGGTGSVQVPIYFEDTLRYIPPELFETNSSPILLNPPIDFANVNDTFYHNPNAYDPDGDSLHFQLVPSLQDLGMEVPLYVFPDQFPPGPNNNFTINEFTGEIIWATPQETGIYNIAILVTEFRNGIKVGTLLRDMEIFVDAILDDPPQIVELDDTCVEAGSTFTIPITASDPNGEIVALSALGGPFEIDPNRAFFIADTALNPIGTFQWNTICEDIQPQPYQIVFKAEDEANGNGVVLSDLESWLIRVVPPKPTGLATTIVNNNDVVLNWDSNYPCFNTPDFQYFSVWRRIGCDSLSYSICDNNSLQNDGYELIADNITTFSYTDFDVDRGNEYSYRIVAHFGKNPTSPAGSVYNRVTSAPSDEACVELPLSLPVIINVSIDETDSNNGEIFVRWTRPKVGPNELDTILDPGPYVFEVYRSTDFNGSNLNLIHTITAPNYSSIVDTSFIDTLQNTVDNAFSYEVRFYAENGLDTLGKTSIASSIYLTIVPGDNQLELSWNENVPWINQTYTIFRSSQFNGVYDSLTTVLTTNYLDTGLINDSTYCYFIRSEGAYTNTQLPAPLINLSQKVCEVPIDTTPPCPINFNIENDCELFEGIVWGNVDFVNRLSWEYESCNQDVIEVEIYFSPNAIDYSLLATTTNTSYEHIQENRLSGCYFLIGIDENGNQSLSSDTICIADCFFYELPNVFTPNNDGANDLYVPFPGWRFVEKIELKIFNRWGNLVFQTENPAINWDGTDQKTGKELEDGVYLYSGFLYVFTNDGTLQKIKLPENEEGSGVIHLIRNK